ncbi:hypothetical protein [Dietzia sp.]|uniref:hypothetical protein n=1 Tax=Dietzia sp. TaxID=1871616 RepID=UPI002FDA0CAB
MPASRKLAVALGTVATATVFSAAPAGAQPIDPAQIQGSIQDSIITPVTGAADVAMALSVAVPGYLGCAALRMALPLEPLPFCLRFG